LSLAVVLLVAVAGCAKVTLENYEKVTNGMTLAEVEDILGRGTVEAGGGGTLGDLSLSGKVVRWGSDEKHIKVTFVNDKVVAKAQQGL
jgi:hypothetical protein